MVGAQKIIICLVSGSLRLELIADHHQNLFLKHIKEELGINKQEKVVRRLGYYRTSG